MTEYVVIVGLISLGVTAGVSTFGVEIRHALGHASARMRGAPTLQLSYITNIRRAPMHSSSAGSNVARRANMMINGSFADLANGQVKLSWRAPTQNVDGSALTTLAGYRIYYGTEPGAYDLPVDIGLVTEFQLTGLEVGRTYYFAISSYDGHGNESALTNEVSKVVTAE